MELKTRQYAVRYSNREMKQPIRSATEVMLAIVEELGEIATVISILEQIRSQAEWKIGSSKERLAEELTPVLNAIFVLVNLCDIDLNETYYRKR